MELLLTPRCTELDKPRSSPTAIASNCSMRLSDQLTSLTSTSYGGELTCRVAEGRANAQSLKGCIHGDATDPVQPKISYYPPSKPWMSSRAPVR